MNVAGSRMTKLHTKPITSNIQKEFFSVALTYISNVVKAKCYHTEVALHNTAREVSCNVAKFPMLLFWILSVVFYLT